MEPLFTRAYMPITYRWLSVDMPERYIINENATILFWKNGEKTIVKKCEEDDFNPRLAFLTAFFQHYCGMSKNKANKYLAGLEVEKKEPVTQKEPKHMKEELKIRDRVCHKRYGRGKIINIDDSSCPILVEFDKENEYLHDGNGIGSVKGKDSHCYWCYSDDLTKEEK